jgi:hypothetical protein
LATILVGRKSWTGLLISIVNSLVVCTIGVRTSQFGFIPANLFCVCVYAFSIRSWLRGQRDRNQTPPPGSSPVADPIDRSCASCAVTVTDPHNRRLGDFKMNQQEHIRAEQSGPITSADSRTCATRPRPGQRGKNEVSIGVGEVNSFRPPGVHSSTQHARRGRFSFHSRSHGHERAQLI